MALVSQNWIGIMVIINLLKGIAILTPSVSDDKIVSLVSQTFDAIRSIGKKKGQLPPAKAGGL
jgi:hypothetical protein